MTCTCTSCCYSNTSGATSEAGTATLPEYLSSPSILSGVHATRSLILCLMFCLSVFVLLTFYCGHCDVSPSWNYGIWLPLFISSNSSWTYGYIWCRLERDIICLQTMNIVTQILGYGRMLWLYQISKYRGTVYSQTHLTSFYISM